MNKEFKPFQRILIKQGVWRAALYSHKEKDGFIITTDGGLRKEELVLPYEGNESLLGTSNDPKPKRWRAERGGKYYLVDDELQVLHSYEGFTDISNNRYQAGNYFNSYEKAEAMAEKLKKTLSDE